MARSLQTLVASKGNGKGNTKDAVKESKNA